MKRLPDPDRVGIVERQFELADRHMVPGDIARELNRAGLRNRREKPFTARRVRETLCNPAYVGEKGYDAIVDRALFDRVHAFLKSRAQTKTGGRPGEPYLLKGIARCPCGAPMYIKRYAAGRKYKCSAAMDARGTCSRPPIPAEPLERAVVDHLDLFLGDVRAFVADKVTDATRERDQQAEAIGLLRQQHRKLDVRAQRGRDQYAKLLDADDPIAPRALREAERFERDRDVLAGDIMAAEERLFGRTDPKVDDLLDFYNELQEAIRGRVRAAEGVEELNRALASALASVMLRIDPDGHAVATFRVREELADRLPFADIEFEGPRLDGMSGWGFEAPVDEFGEPLDELDAETEDGQWPEPRQWLAEPDGSPSCTSEKPGRRDPADAVPSFRARRPVGPRERGAAVGGGSCRRRRKAALTRRCGGPPAGAGWRPGHRTRSP